MKKLVILAAAVGCSSSQNPSPNPPPPWGVPISGGTMLVTQDGAYAVIADPDRDQIVSVDLATKKVVGQLPLSPNEEPGRIAEDGHGGIHVALRRGGALLNLTDAATLSIASRVQVCPEPRGVVWDPATDYIDVACTTGELVSVPSTGTRIVRNLRLDRDLRDVVIANGNLYVSRFRTAELLQLDAQGNIAKRLVPPTVQRLDIGGPQSNGGPVDAIPAVNWRTIAFSGGVMMMHQRQLKTILHETQGGYGGGCGQGPDEDAVTIVPASGVPFAVAPPVAGALPVDIAATGDGTRIAVVTAGSKMVHVFSQAALSQGDDNQCGGGKGGGGMGGGGMGSGSGSGGGSGDGDDQGNGDGDHNDDLGAPTSVGWSPNGDLLVYYPELPGLVIRSTVNNKTVKLPGEVGYDAGRAMFHTQTQVGLACASCHPEARDDGLVWQFETEGTRRTQSIAGDILDRAPYHWSGDMADLPTLMDAVFAVRMAGPTPTHSQHVALGPWLNRVPAPAPIVPLDAQAVARGQALFESAQVGCANCHSGPLLTNHTLQNVGTGATFKVPSLRGVGARPPFLHDGSAPTLLARFGAQGGGDLHGHTAQLNPMQISDLVAYLESL
jgi:hypothetical protein